jgi:hypothetical protein
MSKVPFAPVKALLPRWPPGEARKLPEVPDFVIL